MPTSPIPDARSARSSASSSMVSPPTAAATAPPLSTITDGAVSGVLPAAEAFAVHYPGYPSSPSRAVRSLGGLPAITKARSSDSSARLELRFRPEDPYCHPAFGEVRAATGLVLRIARPKGGSDAPSAEVVARVRNAYHFEGMADFQHVVPVHAADVRKRRRLHCPNNREDLGNEKKGVETDDGDVMMLVPPLFSIKDRPTKIALLPSSNAFSKSMQRGVVQHRWEMDVGPTLALSFNIQVVPTKINWEDHMAKDSAEWNCQMAVCKLFEERPVWPRQSLYERLLDDVVHVSNNQFKRFLFRAGYYFSTGPFGKFWIRRGYDPRKDSESRIYQRVDFRIPPELRNLGRNNGRRSEKWTDICKFEVIPSKTFTFLQFFELDDDFIQAEIRKPSAQATCSHSTGWFSKPMLKTLRLHVSIRFLSIYPNEDAKDFLRIAHALIARSKKEVLFRSEQSEKENQSVDEAAPEKLSETNDQVGFDNYDSEDEAEEEEEEDREESDGCDSPVMAEEARDFALDDSCTLGEGLPNVYLDEVLRSFPLREDGVNKVGDIPTKAEASDGEYEIYEQPSDDDEYSDG